MRAFTQLLWLVWFLRSTSTAHPDVLESPHSRSVFFGGPLRYLLLFYSGASVTVSLPDA